MFYSTEEKFCPICSENVYFKDGSDTVLECASDACDYEQDIMEYVDC